MAKDWGGKTYDEDWYEINAWGERQSGQRDQAAHDGYYAANPRPSAPAAAAPAPEAQAPVAAPAAAPIAAPAAAPAAEAGSSLGALSAAAADPAQGFINLGSPLALNPNLGNRLTKSLSSLASMAGKHY